MKKTKNSMRMLLGAVFVASVSFAFYACSADQQGWEDDMENELELRANAMSKSIKLDTRLDSIMDSEEFLDCIVAFKNLKSKLNEYMAGLDKNGKAALKQAAEWSNVEDPRCRDASMKLYNYMRNEFQAYFNAWDSLEKSQPSVVKLSENENLVLMIELVATSQPALIKNRSEQSCWDVYKNKFDKIDAYWALKIRQCKADYKENTAELAECLANCTEAHNKDNGRIWEELIDCINQSEE